MHPIRDCDIIKFGGQLKHSFSVHYKQYDWHFFVYTSKFLKPITPVIGDWVNYNDNANWLPE